jgi:hypothetical protein
MVDSADLYEARDFAALRERLEDQGYLFIRGVVPREDNLKARTHVLKTFTAKGGILDPAFAMEDGVLHEECGQKCLPYMEGRNDVTHNKVMLEGVLESTHLKTLFAGLLNVKKVRTFDWKWLRAVPTNVFTGCHVDWVYMGRGTKAVLTNWIPFGDNPMEMGTIAVLEGSHKLASFDHFRRTYGQLDTEAAKLDGTGWFCTDQRELEKLGGQWCTSDFKAGDIVLFTMHTVHMSTKNTSSNVRISCDIRWQPEDEAADPRYCGDFNAADRVKSGAHADDNANEKNKSAVTMAQLKTQWGF